MITDKKNYIKRDISKEILRLSQHFQIITITGPRQSGKTTVSKQSFPDYKYFNLEDISIREIISLDPKKFLRKNSKGVILDEVQRMPDLFSYIQVIVDEEKDARFILTGSSNFSLLQNITQSLAGRTALLTLLPLSLQELKEKSKSKTNTLMFNGGYPAIWAKNIPTSDIIRNYFNTYVERDIRQLIKVKNITRFNTFIKLCAGRVGNEFNASALSNETGVSNLTIQDWLSILETSYIIFRIPPFYKNIGKRLIKAPKIYFYDTALVCYLLGIENEEQLATHPLRGNIFENLVALEFLKSRTNKGKEPNFYFYRDKSQHEVDILTLKGNKFMAYEIKSATTFHKSFIVNLQYLKKILKDDLISTQIIYDGDINIDNPENGLLNFRKVCEI